MKKNTKKKKSKNSKQPHKKFRWNVWLTLLSVIGGVSLVCGGTVLGVYLTGGFEEKVVSPESISFDRNSELYNGSQFEVDSNFEIVITSPTENVTQTKVTLSLDNGTASGGVLSNGVVRVPAQVTLGQPFTVEIVQSPLRDDSGNLIRDEHGNTIDWNNGGIALLKATSEYYAINPDTITIAVDVPVYDTTLVVLNSNGEETLQVVTNESFSVATKFIPERSKYIYSDNLNPNVAEGKERMKLSFYEEAGTNKLDAVYDNKTSMHFLATAEQSSTAININGYTFTDAKSQLEFEETIKDIEDNSTYYQRMIEYVVTLATSNKRNTSVIIGDASIDNFRVEKVGQTISMNCEQTFRLFISQYNYQSICDYLGVSIYSTSGALLDRLLTNIAIAFEYNGSDPTSLPNQFLTVVGGEDEGRYVDIEGVRYYKPVPAQNTKYSYWDLNAIEAQNVTIKVVLLTENDSAIFAQNQTPVIRELTLSISKHEELPISWSNQEDLSIMLNYDSNGSVIPASLNLASFINDIPSENIYQDYIFFVSFGSGTKEDYIEKANSVFRSAGYDVNRSGLYATNSGNLTLFAINGTTLTLYDGVEFTLYFATIKTVNSQPQYDKDGLYQIAVMCTGFKRIICEKSLFTDSIEGGSIDTENWTAINDEISMNQGSNLDFGIKFVIKSEAVPVFNDEFQKGYMTPIIKDVSGNDITNYFLIDEGIITIDGDSGKGTLEYRCTLNTSVIIEEEKGIYIGSIALNYNNTNDKNITWEPILEEQSIISIYKPIASKIELANGKLSSALTSGTPFTVIQYLTEDGTFSTTITATLENGTTLDYISISAFLNDLIGANGSLITITDQKTKTDTLGGEWNFVIAEESESVVSLSADKQSFTFRNTDESSATTKLYIQSSDGKAVVLNANGLPLEINLSINSVGVTKLAYANNEKSYLATEEFSEPNKDTTTATVNKFGAKGSDTQFITLSDLVQFYITNKSGDDIEYNNVLFRFNYQYISANNLQEQSLLDLFGEGGMITLYSDNTTEITFNGDYSASNIRATLLTANIYKIHINKHFANSHTLRFTISDEAGAVNTNFNLVLKANISISSVSYPANNEVLYASQDCELTNVVTDYNASTASGNIADFYDAATYYIYYNDNNFRYELTKDMPNAYVATFTQGTIIFNDFWEVESKTFSVYFQPEGENEFTINYIITFVVARDLVVEDKSGTFYVLGGEKNIGDFVEVKRASNGNAITGINIEYVFEKYLTYDGTVNKNTTDKFFFDYNVTNLQTKLYVKLQGSSNENAFDIININIKLYNTSTYYKDKDIYTVFAENLTSIVPAGSEKESIDANLQIIGEGDNAVQYLMLDMTDKQWKIQSLQGYIIKPSNRDYNGNLLTSIYNVNTDLSIDFVSQKTLLAGLNNTSYYLVLKFYADEQDRTELATMHIPVILSNIGYESVVYDGGKVKANRKLDTALTTPEKLIEKGIFNEVTAGGVRQILSQYEYDDVITKGGLYTLSGFMQTLNIYSIDTNVTTNYSNLIKSKLVTTDEDGKAVGTITLNHLASSIGEYAYIAFEYIIEQGSSGNRQSFYYLLKVYPDIKVEETLYAYDGDVEYIEGSTTEINSINLNENYNEITLHDGYKRFNVSKNINLIQVGEVIDNKVVVKLNSESATIKFTYNGNSIIKTFEKQILPDETIVSEFEVLLNGVGGLFSEELSTQIKLNVMIMSGDASIYYNSEKVFSTLSFKNEIASVALGDKPAMTNADEWKEYLYVEFSSDYSVMQYRPLTNEKMTIVLKHSYIGGYEDDNLAVIGGEQYYTFILNETAENYTVKFTYGATSKETDHYIWELDNGNATKEYTLNVDLIKNAQAGGSEAGTIEKNKLDIKLTSANNYLETTEYEGQGFVYNSSTGEFKLKLKDYIDQDREMTFAVYIDQGYLATLIIKLKANASYKLKTTIVDGKEVAIDSLIGGTENAFADLIVVKLGDEEQTIGVDFEITDIKIDNDIVKWIDKKLQVGDLIANGKVTITFTITFTANSEWTYTFSQTYTLIANISPKTSVQIDGNVIAGQDHEIDLTNLYIGSLVYATPSIEVISTSGAFEAYDNANKKVSTNFVADVTSVDLNIKVTLTFNGATQDYNLVYTFTVVPSVTVTANYPKPNSTDILEYEYIQDGTTFADITTNFFNTEPIFGEATRIVVKNGTDYGTNGDEYTNTVSVVEYDNIVISSMENAIVKSGETNIEVNQTIDGNSSITFLRGASGNDSIVIFKVTYQAVTKEYKVVILANPLTATINAVTNNVKTGNYNDSTVSYEQIYVDKTLTTDLFAGGRMIYAELSDNMASVANEYYFVFSKIEGETTKYYASYPIYISPSDQSKDLYYDLGYAMLGKTFVGTYLASDFEKGNLKIGNDGQIIEGDLPTNDYSRNLFDIGSDDKPLVKLSNRIQLVYGQNILVDYEKYSSYINNRYTFASGLDALDNIHRIPALTSFERNDGSGQSYTFNLNYYYSPSIDVEVTEKATNALNYITVEVNQEYLSIVDLFGIKHPTTNRAVSPSEFVGGANLTFDVIYYNSNTETNAILNKYTSNFGITTFKRWVNDDGIATTSDNIYLYRSAIKNANNLTCDYAMIPFGAKNTGDFILGQIQYSANGFTKTFYVVLKIMPDYVVTFNGSSDSGTTEDDGIISNLNSKNIITAPSGNEYSEIKLTGEEGYTTVKHSNGTGDKNDVSVSNFTITMKIDTTIESITYNKQENLSEKFGESLGDWTLDNTTTPKYTYNKNNPIEFNGVKKVIFADQYYMIEGKDAYDFTYRIYFVLQAISRTPVAQNTLSIVENEYFDIGVQYQQLTIQKEGSGSSAKYYINSLPVNPTQTDVDVKLVTLEGIETWQFVQDYAKEDSEEHYLTKNGGNGYSVYSDGGVSLSTDDTKYLALPMVTKVSIEGIKLYNLTGSPITNGEVKNKNGNKVTFTNPILPFATDVEGVFNGMTPRDAQNKFENDGITIKTTIWKMPRIQDTDLFGNSNSANIIMMITLKYQDDSTTEYYDCPVNVNLIRATDIVASNERVVYDGEIFDLQGVDANNKGFIVPDGIRINSLLNDTLEVLVPANSSTTFELSLSRADLTEPIKTSITCQNTGNSFARTVYVSLSQYLGTSVQAGEKITISNVSNSATEFYYISGNGSSTKLSANITVSTINKDVIYVEHADLLKSTGYYGVTKYYIANCGIGGSSYSYRISKDYLVTGRVYKLQREYQTEIGFKIQSKKDNGVWSVAELSKWQTAFSLYEGTTYSDEGSISITKSGNPIDVNDEEINIKSYLQFSLDTSSSSISGLTVGKATITTDGIIQLDDSFESDQYIKVVISLKVSGKDRNIENDDTDVGGYLLTLATLNLSVNPNYTAT